MTFLLARKYILTIIVISRYLPSPTEKKEEDGGMARHWRNTADTFFSSNVIWSNEKTVSTHQTNIAVWVSPTLLKNSDIMFVINLIFILNSYYCYLRTWMIVKYKKLSVEFMLENIFHTDLIYLSDFVIFKYNFGWGYQKHQRRLHRSEICISLKIITEHIYLPY